MFNKDNDSWQKANRAPVTVSIQLTNGTLLRGKLYVSRQKTLIEELNRGEMFLEFEPFEGPKTFLARTAIGYVKELSTPKVEPLDGRIKELDSFDPYEVLGVSRDADSSAIRHAYLTLAKTYHPDRFAQSTLPPEVAEYLSAVAKRINLAYAELRHETMHAEPA